MVYNDNGRRIIKIMVLPLLMEEEEENNSCLPGTVGQFLGVTWHKMTMVYSRGMFMR